MVDLLAVVILHISTVLVIEQGWEEAALLFLVPSHASKVVIITMLYMRTGLHVDDFIQNFWQRNFYKVGDKVTLKAMPIADAHHPQISDA